jgi:hypothetical protein
MDHLLLFLVPFLKMFFHHVLFGIVYIIPWFCASRTNKLAVHTLGFLLKLAHHFSIKK